MKSKGITLEQSRVFLISSIVIFLAAEIVAEIIQLWLVNNPSLSNLNTYNRILANIPGGISTGASVLLAFGLGYQPKGRIFIIAVIGLILTASAFILNSMDFLTSTFEYYPGLHWTVPSGFLSGMFVIGIGTFVAGIMSVVLHDMITMKEGIKA
ncbi:hypothetical protein IX51_06245 [uncultured archaeon]|nr:hypothetical protein IX51_06245 [uncultured archaeon]